MLFIFNRLLPLIQYICIYSALFTASEKKVLYQLKSNSYGTAPLENRNTDKTDFKPSLADKSAWHLQFFYICMIVPVFCFFFFLNGQFWCTLGKKTSVYHIRCLFFPIVLGGKNCSKSILIEHMQFLLRYVCALVEAKCTKERKIKKNHEVNSASKQFWRKIKTLVISFAGQWEEPVYYSSLATSKEVANWLW